MISSCVKKKLIRDHFIIITATLSQHQTHLQISTGYSQTKHALSQQKCVTWCGSRNTVNGGRDECTRIASPQVGNTDRDENKREVLLRVSEL